MKKSVAVVMGGTSHEAEISLRSGAAVAAAAVGVHNLATKDPDYEIVKEMFGSDFSVNYMN